MSAEQFGYPVDEDGNIRFMTVETEYVPVCFAEYMEMFEALGVLAVEYPDYMPILRVHYDKPQ